MVRCYLSPVAAIAQLLKTLPTVSIAVSFFGLPYQKPETLRLEVPPPNLKTALSSAAKLEASSQAPSFIQGSGVDPEVEAFVHFSWSVSCVLRAWG